ncbi:hypothetical protein ElyMa_004609300 [Elysia marginata]|uniref:Uncharacterized protein n=1 Tax=Elysia marginata TaxID=1093978 RepID=A0AAV4HWG9_9GAST|nr:hypothetical protein ElyMa_004609300 [Elysia marginata]
MVWPVCRYRTRRTSPASAPFGHIVTSTDCRVSSPALNQPGIKLLPFSLRTEVNSVTSNAYPGFALCYVSAAVTYDRSRNLTLSRCHVLTVGPGADMVPF